MAASAPPSGEASQRLLSKIIGNEGVEHLTRPIPVERLVTTCEETQCIVPWSVKPMWVTKCKGAIRLNSVFRSVCAEEHKRTVEAPSSVQ